MPILYDEPRRTRVYISGPITGSGSFTANINRGCRVFSALMDKGFAPYLPHANVICEFVDPKPYEHLLALDFEWILACDVVLRLDGVSPGADREVRFALDHMIPVYWSLDTLVAAEQPTRIELDTYNIGASTTADALRRVAETGVHPGVFGGPKVEECAQAILKLHKKEAA